MKINIIAVGKLKERFFREAVEEYTRRLSRYAEVSIVEVKDESVPVGATDGEIKKLLRIEGERIRQHVKPQTFAVLLALEGEEMTSETLAQRLQQLMLDGWSDFTFVIGGTMGLHDSLDSLSRWKLSFSRLTFPHQLMRVILCEQIYRAFTINEGKTYHR